MTTKKDLIKSIMTLASGIHQRVGEDSPVQLLSSLPIQTISEFVCEEEILLETMLKDYCVDNGELEKNMDGMRHTYLDKPSPSSLARMLAYSTGKQEDFLSQHAEIIICEECGTHCYCIGKLECSPICTQCDRDDTFLVDISVRDIPPWIDIDTFCWC